MKYVKPTLEITEMETNDIMLASGEGTITVGETTITGKKHEFASDFSDLLKF